MTIAREARTASKSRDLGFRALGQASQHCNRCKTAGDRGKEEERANEPSNLHYRQKRNNRKRPTRWLQPQLVCVVLVLHT